MVHEVLHRYDVLRWTIDELGNKSFVVVFGHSDRLGIGTLRYDDGRIEFGEEVRHRSIQRELASFYELESCKLSC